MSDINQAEFVGQEQEDGDNRNTSTVMIPQVVSAQHRLLEERQAKLKETICDLVVSMLELLLEVSKPIDENTCKVLRELADVKDQAQFIDRFEKLLNIIPQSGITVYFKNCCLPLLRQIFMLFEMGICLIRSPQH